MSELASESFNTAAGPSLRGAADHDDIRYQVVANDEEQYSIWFADRAPPPGWTVAGPAGTKDECLAHIETVWTDLTPRSVRQANGVVR